MMKFFSPAVRSSSTHDRDSSSSSRVFMSFQSCRSGCDAVSGHQGRYREYMSAAACACSDCIACRTDTGLIGLRRTPVAAARVAEAVGGLEQLGAGGRGRS